MADPTDHPVRRADSDGEYQAVRPDLGGWISGPCLNVEERGLPVDWPPDLKPARPAKRRPGPAQ